MPDNDDLLPTRSSSDSHSSWAQVRRRALDGASVAPQHCKRAENSTRFMSVHAHFIDGAIAFARERGFSPGSDDAWDLVEEALRHARDLTYPLATSFPFWTDKGHDQLTPEETMKKLGLLYNTPPQILLKNAELGEVMPVHRLEFEAAVGDYLQSEVKSPPLDRLILTALVQIEVCAYFEEIHRKDIFQNKCQIEKIAKMENAVVRWIMGAFFNANAYF